MLSDGVEGDRTSEPESALPSELPVSDSPIENRSLHATPGDGKFGEVKVFVNIFLFQLL